MISVAEALAIITRTVGPPVLEAAPLPDSLGRVLARDIHSDVDWPPFDTTAMDGYAVRVADVPEPGTLLEERSGAIAAGEALPGGLRPGQTARVMTGAPLPSGTEAIIPVEQARREGDHVRFQAAPASGDHIRRRAESIASGSRLLQAGRRLDSGHIALAALAGADPIPVFARPRVSIAATGDELVASNEKPGPGKLRDSNGPMLLSLCRAFGWPARARPRVADQRAGVESLFVEAGREEDVLLTSGGVSVGDFDILPEAARSEGFEILFHGVSVRPGKPIVFARRGRTLWFGLPGNPVSSAVGFQVFVRFALDIFEGNVSPGARRVTAQTVAGLPAGGRRETYLDSVLSDANGVRRVEPLRSAGSHDIAAHARANALIRLPAERPALPEGSLVECLLTRD